MKKKWIFWLGIGLLALAIPAQENKTASWRPKKAP